MLSRIGSNTDSKILSLCRIASAVLLSLFCLVNFNLQATESLGYSGRLVNPDGRPVTGDVDMLLELAYSGSTGTILCSKSYSDVPLSNGLFYLKVDFDCGASTFNHILSNVPLTESIVIRVTNNSAAPAKVYPFQAFYSVPFANIAQTLAIKGTAVGQILKWDGTNWVPGTASASSGGTVTQIIAGNGLSGGTITTSGTIGIASGGVTSTEIANGAIVDADVSALAAITRAKLAGGTPNYVIVNNGAGGISEVQNLSLAQGGTGAVDALGARINLGLGTAALAGIGNAAGNVMRASDVPACLAHEKLQMGVGPAYPWTCVNDLDTGDDTRLSLAGGTMAGEIDMAAHKIIEVAGPTDDGDAANKKYVDDQIVSKNVWTKVVNDINYDSGKVSVGVSLRFKDSGANYVELRAPAVVGSTYALTLPAALGTAGQVLTTDASGVLSWSTVATTATPVGGDLTGTIANAQIGAGAIVDADVNAGANIAQSKIAGLTTSLAGKEPLIASGAATDYMRGDKSWQTLNTAAVPESGNLYFTQPRVLATPLTGFGTSTSDVVAADTILSAFGKLQGQIDAAEVSSDNKYVAKSGSTMTGNLVMGNNTVTGLAAPSADTDASTKLYVDTQFGAINASQWTTSAGNIYYNGGNVGIGTTVPNVNLHLNSAGDTNLSIESDLPNTNEELTPALRLFADGRLTRSVIGLGGGTAEFPGVTENSLFITSTTGDPAMGAGISFITGTNASNSIKMKILESGNIGIGTITPVSTLNVVGGTAISETATLSPGLAAPTPGQALVSNSTGSNYAIHTANNNAGIGPGILFKRSEGTVAVPLPVNNGDQLFGLFGAGYTSAGAYGNNTAVIKGNATESYTSVAQGANLTFETTPNGSVTRMERMRIAETGYVGIGSNSPTEKLTVVDSNSTPGQNVFSAQNTNSAGAGQFSIKNNGTGQIVMQASGSAYTGTSSLWNKGTVFTSGNLTALTFMTNGDLGSGGTAPILFQAGGNNINPTMIITAGNTGNVGIGTIAPLQKLQVKGAVAYETDNSVNYVSIKSPNSLAATYSLTLPPGLGSNGQVLTTTATGILSWSTPATSSTNVGGELSGSIASATINNDTITSAKIVDGAIVDADISAAAGIAQSKIANLTTDLAGKQPLITAGATTDYWRGDKTWQTLNTSVVPEGSREYHTPARVMASLLGGYTSGTAIPLATTDTLSQALGKLEAGLASVQADGRWNKNGTSYYYNGGNVGIGTSTPSAPFQVYKSGVNDPIAIFGSTGTADAHKLAVVNGSGSISLAVAGNSNNFTPGSAVGDAIFLNGVGKKFLFSNGSARTDLTIDGTGKVGIGTTLPEEALQIGNISGGAKKFTIPGTYNFERVSLGQTGNGGSALEFVTHTGPTHSQGWRIGSDPDANIGNLSFSYAGAATAYNSLSFSPSMSITSAGNVGIGTTTPDSLLTLKLKPGNPNGISIIEDDVSPTDAYFRVSNATSAVNTFIPIFYSKSNATTSSYASGFVSDTNTDAVGEGPVVSFMARANNSPVTNRDLFDFSNLALGTGTTVMRIKANGNVGIGTTDPGSKLSVSGNSAATHISTVIATASLQNANATVGALNTFLFANYDGFASAAISTSQDNIGNAGNKLILQTKKATTGAWNANQLVLTTLGDVGIGALPKSKLYVENINGSTGDFVGYPGSSVGNVWPKGFVPEAIFQRTGGAPVANQSTYRGGIGLGEGVGIYSLNPNTSGSQFYGDIRFHNTIWNGTGYTNIDRMIIDMIGNVGIGTSSPSEKLHVVGNILASGTITPSDKRLKKNIVPVSNAMRKIASLQGVTYDWKDPKKHSPARQMGVIAQDVQKVFPEAVIKTNDGFLAVSYSVLVAPLIESVKELFNSSEVHTKEIAKLNKENAELKARLDRLEHLMESQKRLPANVKAKQK